MAQRQRTASRRTSPPSGVSSRRTQEEALKLGQQDVSKVRDVAFGAGRGRVSGPGSHDHLRPLTLSRRWPRSSRRGHAVAVAVAVATGMLAITPFSEAPANVHEPSNSYRLSCRNEIRWQMIQKGTVKVGMRLNGKAPSEARGTPS